MAEGSKKVIRSAVTGQFVTKAQARKSPRTTVTQTTGGESHADRFRSTDTGQFVTKEHAVKHPKTTIKESGS